MTTTTRATPICSHHARSRDSPSPEPSPSRARGVPPISCVTRLWVCEARGFPRSAPSPPSVAAAVRVGTQCRVNGAPLLVASVRPAGRDGRDVVATFGAAMNSRPRQPVLAQTGEEVRFEVDTESVNDDISDAAAIKRARETQGGLGNARVVQQHASVVHQDVSASEFEDRDERLRRRLGIEPRHARVPTYESPRTSPHVRVPTYRVPTYESPRTSPHVRVPSRPPRTARPRRRNGSRMSARTVRSRRRARRDHRRVVKIVRPRDVDERIRRPGRFPRREVRIRRQTVWRRWRGDADPLTRPGLTARIRIARRGTTAPGRRSRVRSARIGESRRRRAAERLARRNSHLTDRVETLLDMIETKGFGDEEVMDGLKQLGDSHSGRETTRRRRRARRRTPPR